MERRKFVLGLGSLAAGGAAAMGTGAIEQMDSGDRAVTLAATNDNSAYFQLEPGKYSQINGDGKLEIVLNSLNPSSTSTLDDVYYIRNSRPQTMDVWVTDGSSAVTHRRSSNNDSLENSGNSVPLGPGQRLSIAVEVNAGALSLNSNTDSAGRTFEVHYQE